RGQRIGHILGCILRWKPRGGGGRGLHAPRGERTQCGLEPGQRQELDGGGGDAERVPVVGGMQPSGPQAAGGGRAHGDGREPRWRSPLGSRHQGEREHDCVVGKIGRVGGGAARRNLPLQAALRGASHMSASRLASESWKNAIQSSERSRRATRWGGPAKWTPRSTRAW